MKLWHIAALLLAGIAVGVTLPGRLTGVFGQATLYVFLPALIFEAAWNLDFHLVRRAYMPIALLALPGVALTAAVIAACAHYTGAFAWESALVLGAVLSATDPVAVVAVFRRLDVPAELATIVVSESLLNDAVAVALYRVFVTIAVTSSAAGILRSGTSAAIGVFAGIASGVVLAWFVAFALRRSIGASVQCAATLAGAYAGYILADRFGWSGIFTVLAFGVVLRELERHRIAVAAAAGVAAFWESAALMANVVLFFLIGAALDLTQLRRALPAAAVTVGAVLLARVVVSYGLLAAERARMRPFWRTVVRMAGIRGALSLALALATPVTLVQRSLIVDATFAVVVVTILVGTLTLTPRLERLKLS